MEPPKSPWTIDRKTWEFRSDVAAQALWTSRKVSFCFQILNQLINENSRPERMSLEKRVLLIWERWRVLSSEMRIWQQLHQRVGFLKILISLRLSFCNVIFVNKIRSIGPRIREEEFYSRHSLNMIGRVLIRTAWMRDATLAGNTRKITGVSAYKGFLLTYIRKKQLSYND